jgi:hypothetical protein
MSIYPIITKLGGRDSVYKKLQASGFAGSIHALRMWGVRRSIPGDAILLLMSIAEAESIETCAADFQPLPVSDFAVEAAE